MRVVSNTFKRHVASCRVAGSLARAADALAPSIFSCPDGTIRRPLAGKDKSLELTSCPNEVPIPYSGRESRMCRLLAATEQAGRETAVGRRRVPRHRKRDNSWD
jgi:hypothetical protein